MTGISVHSIVDVDRLPTLPSIAVEAIRLMEGESSSFESLATLLKNDQVLTSRIIHYANSAYIGARRQVASISQAISVLGFNTVRTIILSSSVFDCFSSHLADEHRQRLLNFWLHSIGVAVTAEKLAERLAFPVPEEAYIAGLMHDIGKLVCYTQLPERFEKLSLKLEEQGSYTTRGALPLDLEKEVLGTDHIEVGHLVAEQWGFPEVLTRVLWLHHQPSFETILPDPANLPKLIRFADVLCVTHNVGSSYFLPHGSYSHDHFHFALENMLLHHHLTPADVDTLMAEVEERVKEVGSVLGFWNEEEYRKMVSVANISLGSVSRDLEWHNRELATANRVLDATIELGRSLRPGQSPSEAAGVIIAAARKAFGVQRCLCLVREASGNSFIGQIGQGESFVPVRIPANLGELKRYASRPARSDIEAEAIERLSHTALTLSSGAALESALVEMATGSQFLATFFVSSQQSNLRKAPILGELVIDYAGAEIQPDSDHHRHFETFALAAANGVERLLLEQSLNRQAEEMAKTSRRMEESQRQLFHSHRLATVGRLAAGAAHEINNPLTIISLNIQILDRMLRELEDPAIKERLRTIADQEERISKIIQDLMSFARPTQPKFTSSSVARIMEQVLSVLGDRVSMANITIDNRIPDDLPDVMVDPLQIEQVFMNLLINANHAMPDGGTIALEGVATNGNIEIRVTDSGVGISPANLNKIFDPFFTTKKEGEGTGLGLAICHSIVEHNGGSMRVKSKVGKGTTFTVGLPIDKSSRLQAMKRGLSSRQETVCTPQDPCRILVVDDERVLNEMLLDSLKSAGYQADGAFDGVEAIRQLQEKTYHLVILDIRMPRKDGLEVLKFIKEEYPEIQVLIITALATKEEIKNTVKMGAFACLKKPFRLETVLETVERGLQSRCTLPPRRD